MLGVCFWDWNGTLLSDAAYALGVRNRSFPRFGLPRLENIAQYREQFTFPVQEYYRRAGVADADFERVANAWMDEYMAGCESLPLRKNAKEAVEGLHQAGVTQVILSASKIDALREQLGRFSIAPLFQELLGLGHIYATSKEAIGRSYIEQKGLDPKRCLMIGDSEHDWQVASALGMRCILVTGGHQTEKALRGTGCPVARGLKQAGAMALDFFSTGE